MFVLERQYKTFNICGFYCGFRLVALVLSCMCFLVLDQEANPLRRSMIVMPFLSPFDGRHLVQFGVETSAYFCFVYFDPCFAVMRSV